MAVDDILLTNNWGALSNQLTRFGEGYGEDQVLEVQYGRTNLVGAEGVLMAVALALNCNRRSSIYPTYEQCSMNDNVIINNVLWDKATLSSIFNITKMFLPVKSDDKNDNNDNNDNNNHDEL